MSRVRESIDVDVPLHVAYERMCHFEEYPQFMGGVREVTQISADISHWVMEFDGTPAEFDARVVDRRPDELLAWESVDGPHLTETVMFESLSDDSTRIVAELELEARALMPSAAYGEESLDRRLKADLDGFKHYIEEHPGDMLPGMAALRTHNVMPANPAPGDGGILGTSALPPATPQFRRPGSGPTNSPLNMPPNRYRSAAGPLAGAAPATGPAGNPMNTPSPLSGRRPLDAPDSLGAPGPLGDGRAGRTGQPDGGGTPGRAQGRAPARGQGRHGRNTGGRSGT